jgi:hypothetical protein
MRTTEFMHYHGCRGRDPDNCSGCALTHGGNEGPNYSAWPLAYIENRRSIPIKWRNALVAELRSDNRLYADNIRAKIAQYDPHFSDGSRVADMVPQ